MAATVISREVRGSIHLITASGTTPEGSVAAPPGSVLLSEGGVFYTKASGTGNTGWSNAFLVGSILPIANGGTGQTTAAAARVALLPAMTGNALEFLRVNSAETDYETVAPEPIVRATDLTGISFASDADITSASTVLQAFGQLQAKFNAGAPTFLSYAGGSQAFTAATFSDVLSTTLTFPSTGFYEFEFAPLYDAALTSTGSAFSVDGTAVFDYMACEVIYRVSSGNRAAHAITVFNTLIASVDSLSTTNNRALLRGTINVTTAGTILLRAATETPGSAITVTAVQAFIRKRH